MDLEQWVLDLLTSIHNAAELEAGFKLELDEKAVKTINHEWESCE